jgi:hypothetical protein
MSPGETARSLSGHSKFSVGCQLKSNTWDRGTERCGPSRYGKAMNIDDVEKQRLEVSAEANACSKIGRHASIWSWRATFSQPQASHAACTR